MNLESQVCTLEQAIRLRMLGVAQESVFYTDRNSNIYIEYNYPTLLCLESLKRHDGTTVETFSRFTSAELGSMLPHTSQLRTWINADGKSVCAWSAMMKCTHPTEAQARAAMVIYLLENSNLNVEDFNSRLQTTKLRFSSP
jgi:hypothetical protein